MAQFTQIVCHERDTVGLHKIHRPEVRGVVCKQTPDPGLEKFLDWLRTKPIPSLEFTTGGKDFDEKMLNSLRLRAPEPDNLIWQNLIDHVRQMTDLYLRVSGARQARVEFRNGNVVAPNFHVDGGVLRMLVTYLGQGTHYLSPGPVFLSKPGDQFSTAKQTLYFDDDFNPADIRQAGPLDILLLKAKNYPAHFPPALYHASPLEREGRFMMVIGGTVPEDIKRRAAKRKLVRQALKAE